MDEEDLQAQWAMAEVRLTSEVQEVPTLPAVPDPLHIACTSVRVYQYKSLRNWFMAIDNLHHMVSVVKYSNRSGLTRESKKVHYLNALKVLTYAIHNIRYAKEDEHAR